MISALVIQASVDLWRNLFLCGGGRVGAGGPELEEKLDSEEKGMCRKGRNGNRLKITIYKMFGCKKKKKEEEKESGS